MKNKTLIHKLFKTSIFLKGIFAFIELVSGIFLFFVTSDLLLKFVNYVFGHELVQDPTDIFVNFLLNLFSNFSGNIKIFFAIYLLVHGIIKLGLIMALWKEKLWAYPVSEIIFISFIIYQIYRYIKHPSVFLILLTLLDVMVIILIYLEYKGLKQHYKTLKYSPVFPIMFK